MKKPANNAAPWSEREEALLGTMTDAALAAKIGRTRKAVENQRRKLGVAGFVPHERHWSKRELALLGEMSDAALAARLGISRRCVLMTRRRRGVLAYSPKHAPLRFRAAGH